jgi:hypothetical protein
LFKKTSKVKTPIVKDLEDLEEVVEEELVKEFGQEAIDTMKAKLASGTHSTTGLEADIYILFLM